MRMIEHLSAMYAAAQRRLPSARSEGGFTMIVALGVLLVSSLLLTAAFVAAGGDIHLSHNDTVAKKAYYAAQAGVNDYLYHLTQDGNYLTYCTTPTPANPALNQISEKTKNTAPVPAINGEVTNEKYAIDLLPAEGSEGKCNTAEVFGSMIEQSGTAAGTFRIESTGFAENKQRSIVATFKNLNFVSFVWYTVYETADPVVYGKTEKEHLVCGAFYPERRKAGICGQFNNYFISGESVNGPVHTEDHAGICGSPIFGRKTTDRIEFGTAYEKDEGYSSEECGGSASPKFVGTHIPVEEVPSLKPPPGDEELEHIVEPAYNFLGKTEVVLEGTKMKIIEHKGEAKKEVTKENVAYPPSGVIYVKGSCEKYTPFGPNPTYTEDANCGNVYVHGKYEKALTIAAQNDVVINGNITTPVNGSGTPTGTALLGLIANNFVRVFHPLAGSRGIGYTECGSSSNSPEDLKEPTIYAAILALKHSLMVDNFDCGKAELGSLNVYGTVAGMFSNGMTGVFSGGGGIIHGYPYNLKYDNRLQISEPPHFLNPIEAAWYIQRETLAPAP
jgi:Tfp pilus assembly protein PilX